MKRNVLILIIVGIVLTLVSYLALRGSTIGAYVGYLGDVLEFAAWVLAMVATIRIGRWGWFVIILLLSWVLAIPIILYGIIGPTERKA